MLNDFVEAIGKVLGGLGFFKKPELCSYGYASSSLIYNDDDKDDVKNFHSIKFSGFNTESLAKVEINKFFYKKIHEYNTFILDILDNTTAAGTTLWTPGIILLFCVIVSIIIALILHAWAVPWWKINGQPVMPGPYRGEEGKNFWPNCPKPRPMEPPVIRPPAPNPAPFPLKDPGKKK